MYDRVNKYTAKCLLIIDGQIKSKRLCRSTFCERDMLSNCVKHKLDAWWLEMRDLDKLKSKLGIIMEERMYDHPVNISMVCNHCKNLLEETYTSAILLRVF